MGRGGLVARKIAATLTSTGTPAFFLHPVEALHGDAGLVEAGDIALVLSKSGAGDELDGVLPLFARLGVPVIALTEHADSPLARAAQAVIAFGPLAEAGEIGGAPTTSTLVSMALATPRTLAQGAARRTTSTSSTRAACSAGARSCA